MSSLGLKTRLLIGYLGLSVALAGCGRVVLEPDSDKNTPDQQPDPKIPKDDSLVPIACAEITDSVECAQREDCDILPGVCFHYCQSTDPGCCSPDQCVASNGCQQVVCTLACPDGFKKGADGCDVCECADPDPLPECNTLTESECAARGDCGWVVQPGFPGDIAFCSEDCAPVTCMLACDQGFKRDAAGCEICECAEPAPLPECNTLIEGECAQRADCEWTTQPGFPGDISFCRDACHGVVCALACPNGFKKDADGCEICECAEPPATCAAMDAELDGPPTFTFHGYKWDGSACVPMTGQPDCLGADCGDLFMDLASCELTYSHCLPRTPASGICIKNSNDTCGDDSDCVAGGCGGELCYNPAVSSGISTCECTTPVSVSCGCVAGSCTWWN